MERLGKRSDVGTLTAVVTATVIRALVGEREARGSLKARADPSRRAAFLPMNFESWPLLVGQGRVGEKLLVEP